MGILTRLHDFVNGETADGDEVDAELNQILDEFNGNIESANLADSSVGTTELASNAVTVGKISDNAVETSKIKDLNVTNPKLADGAVDTEELASGSVTLTEIAAQTLIGTSTDQFNSESGTSQNTISANSSETTTITLNNTYRHGVGSIGLDTHETNEQVWAEFGGYTTDGNGHITGIDVRWYNNENENETETVQYGFFGVIA